MAIPIQFDPFCFALAAVALVVAAFELHKTRCYCAMLCSQDIEMGYAISTVGGHYPSATASHVLTTRRLLPTSWQSHSRLLLHIPLVEHIDFGKSLKTSRGRVRRKLRTAMWL